MVRGKQNAYLDSQLLGLSPFFSFETYMPYHPD
jgi:hypothetical protein